MMTLPDLDRLENLLRGLVYHLERKDDTSDSLAIALLARGIVEREAVTMRDAAISQLPGNTSKFPPGWHVGVATT